MENYIITVPFVQINVGAVIGLTKKQVKKRKFALNEVKKGVYEVINPFHLKMGETFQTDEKIDKKIAHMIVDEKTFGELPIAEKIKDFTRVLLKKYADENCKGLKLDLTKKNDHLKKQIVDFVENSKTNKAPNN